MDNKPFGSDMLGTSYDGTSGQKLISHVHNQETLRWETYR